MHFRAHTEKC